MMKSRGRISLLGGSILAFAAAAGAWYLFDPSFRAGREVPTIAADMPQDELDRRGRNYVLAANPEVRIAALRGYEAREREAAESEGQAVLRACAEPAPALRITGRPTFVVGDEIIRGLVNLATLRRVIADAPERPED